MLQVKLLENNGSTISCIKLNTVHVVLTMPVCELILAVIQRSAEEGRTGMWTDPESERFVACSERVVIGCECGERLILLGLEDDWRSRRAIFKCECGRKLTLDGHIDEALAAM